MFLQQPTNPTSSGEEEQTKLYRPIDSTAKPSVGTALLQAQPQSRTNEDGDDRDEGSRETKAQEKASAS